ncbi:hypothetical protein GF359_07890 [candidate division WOR-3 bacterium]|uniref:Chaperone protein DnaJ n=1 Tax=candidate division WOR-3 bacterium TaxID=2052148 RepID=A0A9D5KCI1_UNCW3|nr:hypothetical protein [candidate division WOR-3 bacterium]MBD3365121.1 hypothetical protein [candidate division WOR-3 bacterium]
MSPDLSNIDAGKKYKVDIEGVSYEVEGGQIISAVCPKCKGAGMTSEEGKEPEMCPVCGGMGMYDYSQAKSISEA